MKRNCLFALLGSMGAALTVIVILSAIRLSTAGAEGVDQGQPATASAALSGTKTFIQRHCADCHDSTTKEAGLDLTKLPFEPEDKSNLAIWVRVHDRVGSGEMPPKTEPRPAASELKSFVDSLASILTDFEKELTAREGRSVQRRLNRYEYENVLRDLLDVPWLAVKDKLPPDGEAFHYNKIGEALDMSHIQMARFMMLPITPSGRP